jgi:glutaredoxin 3
VASVSEGVFHTPWGGSHSRAAELLKLAPTAQASRPSRGVPPILAGEGCPRCTEPVELVEFLAGTEQDVEIRDMHDAAAAVAASGYGIRRLPAVVIDGRLADWYAGRDLDEATLTQAIFG